MENMSRRKISEPEHRLILGLGHPAAMFHRESNLHIGFLSGKTRS